MWTLRQRSATPVKPALPHRHPLSLMAQYVGFLTPLPDQKVREDCQIPSAIDFTLFLVRIPGRFRFVKHYRFRYGLERALLTTWTAPQNPFIRHTP